MRSVHTRHIVRLLEKADRQNTTEERSKKAAELYKYFAEHARWFIHNPELLNTVQQKTRDLLSQKIRSCDAKTVVVCSKLIRKNTDLLVRKMQTKWRTRDVTSFKFMLYPSKIKRYCLVLLHRIEKYPELKNKTCENFVSEISQRFSRACMKTMKTEIAYKDLELCMSTIVPLTKKYKVLLDIRERTAIKRIQKAWKHHSNNLDYYINQFDLGRQYNPHNLMFETRQKLQIAIDKLSKHLHELKSTNLYCLINSPYIFKHALSADYYKRLKHLKKFLKMCSRRTEQNCAVTIQRWWLKRYHAPNGTF